MTYPYRQTELLNVLNGMLLNGACINSYDLLCFRRINDIDTNPMYCHTPKFGTTQYSDAFVRHVITSHQANRDLFTQARRQYFDATHES